VKGEIDMEWQVILALMIAIPIILFPAAFIWYLNIGGIYAAIKEGKLKVFEPIARAMRIGLAVIVPVAAYALLIWFFLGSFGWQVALALALALPIILVPAALIWYINIGGIYAAIKEARARKIVLGKRQFKVLAAAIVRRIRIGLAVIVPVGVYASLIWFFLGNFGWQVALAIGLALPIVLFVPVLVWAAVVSGLYLVARDALRRRAIAPRRRAVGTAEEPVLHRIT